MKNYFEQFLSEYFLIECVAGRFAGEPRKLYNRLSEIFLAGNDATELFALTENDIIEDIKTISDYKRFCRIRRYDEMLGMPDELDGELAEIITIKGSALERVSLFKFDSAETRTDSAVFSVIENRAAQGVVAAMRILGIAQCEGFYVERSIGAGLAYLEKAAQWNDIEGILAALYYDKNNRRKNIDRLSTVVSGTVYHGYIERAERHYGIKASSIVQESKLLQRAFATNTLKPEIYSSKHARFLFSRILTPRDKERTMFGAPEQVVSDIADLPLKLTALPVPLDKMSVRKLPIERKHECDRIVRCLGNIDLRERSEYRPLCICADSEYLRKLFARVLADAFAGAHIENIDVSALDAYDFEPTINNVFLRSCDEDNANVYFLSFAGNLPDGSVSEATAFLDSGKRKRFGLLRPGVVVNLGVVLPICFCDKANAKMLKQHCDIVNIAPIGADEKTAVIYDIVSVCKKLYGVNKITLEQDAETTLGTMSVDRIASVIDAAVRFNRQDRELAITAEIISECAGDGNDGAGYGFGGKK